MVRNRLMPYAASSNVPPPAIVSTQCLRNVPMVQRARPIRRHSSHSQMRSLYEAHHFRQS